MADTKKTAAGKKSATPKKKPAVRRPAPPPPTREDLHAALLTAQLAHEKVQYFRRRLRSAKSHDTESIRKGLVEEATAGLAEAETTYRQLTDSYMALKAKVYEGAYQRRA